MGGGGREWGEGGSMSGLYERLRIRKQSKKGKGANQIKK